MTFGGQNQILWGTAL